MAAAVNESVLSICTTGEAMPTQFLQASEVRRPEDLEYADFLLRPQAKPRSIDLCWACRAGVAFAAEQPNKFREKDSDKEEAERLLVMTGQCATARRTWRKIRSRTRRTPGPLKERYARAGRMRKGKRCWPTRCSGHSGRSGTATCSSGCMTFTPLAARHWRRLCSFWF